MFRPMLVFACSLLVAPVAATAADKDEAFKVDKRSFKDSYRVIALAPVDAEPLLGMPAAVAQLLEAEISARLQKEKFTVIPSSVLASIREEMTVQVGGLIDPATGQLDPAKAMAVREHAFRELWFREKFDALGLIRVSIIRVPMENDRVEWDGVKRKLVYEGRGKKYSASVTVSSVAFSLYDSTNRPIFSYFGGLEPVMYRADEQLLPLTADKLFLNEEHIREAAEVSVDPF